MDSRTVEAPPRIEVQVESDRLSAYLVFRGQEGESLETREVADALADAKIAVTDEVQARVNEFVETVRRSGAPERFLVARGRPKVEGQDAEFIWDVFFQQAVEDWREDAPINYYTNNTIVTADAGQRLGTIVPAKAGRPGLDVHGNAIPLKRRPVSISLDETVGPSEGDPQVIVSRVPGRVRYSNHTLGISEVLDIRGDVDFETGSIRSSVDVNVGGTVRDHFVVCSEKSIAVSGAIEAADVQAAGDVVVRGGILGHHRGSVRAEGEIVAKFSDRGNLRAGGDIKIARLIMDSRVHTEGKLWAERAAVIGGLVYARQCIEAGTLGSEAHVPTVLVLGVHWNVLTEARAIDKRIDEMQRTAARIHEVADPLMANLKRLSASQKERATELLFKIQELDLAISDREQTRDAMLKAAGGETSPVAIVSKIIHPGVQIRIHRRRVVFEKEMKGPLRIEKRLVDRTKEFVAVNQFTGSVTVLSSERIEGDPTPVEGEK